MRLNMLLKTIERSPHVKLPSLHVSLNFAPEEQHSKEFLKQLAQEYLEGIGFGDQPYLVYQHFDSGHPHIHLVTTKIRPDGSCINTHNIGRGISTTVRKEMEIRHGLVKAQDHNKAFFKPKEINPAIVQYGKVSTKRAISSILSNVLDSYKYTSLEELNALLKLYNVTVQRGDKDSRMYRNKGLAYRVINKDGNPISTPILASAFHQKALLKDIEKRFLRNDLDRQQHKTKARVAIDNCLRSAVISVEQIADKLGKTGVDLILRRNADGYLYGVTFIDHRSKCIFNGSDLGKQYSAAALLERCNQSATQSQSAIIDTKEKRVSTYDEKQVAARDKSHKITISVPGSGPQGNDEKTLIEQLMQAEYNSNYLPFELRKNPRKKKRKKTNHL